MGIFTEPTHLHLHLDAAGSNGSIESTMSWDISLNYTIYTCLWIQHDPIHPLKLGNIWVDSMDVLDLAGSSWIHKQLIV